MAYVNPETNIQGSGYHINQALIAIGSGGITGVGYGQSTAKVGYLPEPIGDSIFAVIAEEFGFLGAVIVIIIFAILVTRIFILSMRTEHKFGQLLLVGFGSIISIQSFVNIAAISGLIPLTGMSLPFISYGGTGMVATLSMLGIAVNVSSYSRNV
jgi:cell division protein FtsW